MLSEADMSKALSEGVLQSEISRRKLMQTSTVGGLALASGAHVPLTVGVAAHCVCILLMVK